MGKYLTVDDRVTDVDQIIVSCDGFTAVFEDAGTGNPYDMVILDLSSNILLNHHNLFETAAGTFSSGYGNERTVHLIENSPSRVVIKTVGWFWLDDDSTPLGSADNVLTTYYYIYSNRIICDCNYQTDSTTITLNADQDKNGFVCNGGAGISSPTGINEASDAEENAPGTDEDLYPTTIQGFRSAAANIVTTVLHHNLAGGSASFQQFFDQAHEWYTGWVDGTITEGAHRIVIALLIDSADRQNDGGTFLDWDTDIDTNAVTVGTICEQSTDSLRYICHTAHTARHCRLYRTARHRLLARIPHDVGRSV